eukprot:TRINITY_DN11706_c0_g1_i5.p1 TRINITY_DN11706_c0_g1~~TRINITY_DN11706_c0_g1_i5.p1  ORF type:complete len:908 (-),score=233.16 TRINITY_DN11706_c0_g1_i5:29-2398(-)
MPQDIRIVADIVTLCLKIFRRIIIHGFPSFVHQPDLLTFFASALERLQHLCTAHELPRSQFSAYIEQSIILYQKLFIKVQSAQPISFVPMLQACMYFFHNQIKSLARYKQQGRQPLERALIQSMLFFKNVLQCQHYKPDTDDSLTPSTPYGTPAIPLDSPTMQAAQTLKAFFTPEVVGDFAQTLILNYLVLTPAEMSEWDSDPEEFMQRMGAESWKDNRRPCAEALFSILMQNFSSSITPSVVALLGQILQQERGADPHLILVKEACYTSLGLGYHDLYDAVDLPSLMSNVLVKEMQNPDPRYKFVRRRIAWVIGCWVANFPNTMRHGLYQIVVALVQDQDLVLALTAIDTLKALVDDVNFTAKGFAEFLSPTMAVTMQLLVGGRVHEADTKLRILTFVHVLLEQVGPDIRPYTTTLLLALGELWKANASQNHDMIKSSVLRTLTQLVGALASDPSEFYHVLLPAVQYSTDPASPDAAYLMEDGLGLWSRVLQYAPSPHQGLLDIYPNITRIMQGSVEHLDQVLPIMDGYLMMGHQVFLAQHGQAMADTLYRIMGDLSPKGTLMFVKPIETLLQMFPQQGTQLIMQVLLKILAVIMAKTEQERVTVCYLGVLARVALENAEGFLDVFRIAARMQNTPDAFLDLLALFIDIWLEKIDNMTSLQRKLSALAMCNLLPGVAVSSVSCVGLARMLPLLVTTIVGVIPDAEESRSESSLGYEDLELEELVGRSSAESQMRNLIVKDPVNKRDLREFLSTRVRDAEALAGPRLQQLMATVDPIILRTLHEPPAKR